MKKGFWEKLFSTPAEVLEKVVEEVKTVEKEIVNKKPLN